MGSCLGWFGSRLSSSGKDEWTAACVLVFKQHTQRAPFKLMNATCSKEGTHPWDVISGLIRDALICFVSPPVKPVDHCLLQPKSSKWPWSITSEVPLKYPHDQHAAAAVSHWDISKLLRNTTLMKICYTWFHLHIQTQGSYRLKLSSS